MSKLSYIFAGISIGKSDVSDWSTTPGDNGNSDPAINFAENQNPGSVNNSARALMAEIRAWAEQSESANTYAGTVANEDTNAIRITPAVIPSSMTEGAMYYFLSPTTNTRGVTLQVGALAAARVFKSTGKFIVTFTTSMSTAEWAFAGAGSESVGGSGTSLKIDLNAQAMAATGAAFLTVLDSTGGATACANHARRAWPPRAPHRRG